MPAPSNTPATPEDAEVLSRLHHITRDQGVLRLSEALAALQSFIAEDLLKVEADIERLPDHGDKVTNSARHLLALKGKRLRPLCVLLAARCGQGSTQAVLPLAAAVELVHSGTLLHDDVIDLGELRRGEPAARVVYGNAASVYAGDWLLIEALSRVHKTGDGETLGRLLSTIDEMIRGEAVQLEHRGRLVADRAVYFQVIEGKTAALFRWGLWAGARAGGLGPVEAEAIGSYGRELGLAFQLIDDALDFAGDAHATGKSLFADLREGKLTFPLLLGLERDPSLSALLEGAIGGEALSAELAGQVLERLHAAGAIEDCRALAAAHSEKAVACLSALPESVAKQALAVVATASVRREA